MKLEGFTQLYRYYDGRGKLLYVGISLSAALRLGQHRKKSGWYRKVARMEIENHPTRDVALRAEALAIAAESPRHNTIRPETHPDELNSRLISGSMYLFS
jgi:hypothetical protein